MERVSLKPLFNASARQGIAYGILFTMMSACLLGSMHIPSLSMMILLLAVAALAYLPASLARVAAQHPSYCTFPALWMSGIVQFAGGALICALLTALFLIYLSPDFLSQYIKQAMQQLAAMQQSPETAVLNEQLKNAVFPTPMQFVSSMFWVTAFFGSMAGFILGILLPHASFFRRLIIRNQSKLTNS